MNNFKWEALIIAAGLVFMGKSIEMGMNHLTDSARSVNVKGLSEMEVEANKVTWPLMYKQVGNNLLNIYAENTQTNQIILKFLKEHGIDEKEITINAPEIIDLNAERYTENRSGYRYNVTTVITVTSSQVDLVRKLINEQSELLKQGVAITAGDYRYAVQYDYTGLNDIKPKMIEEATKNARAAAEKFAKDSDSELGKIKHAYQGQFTISDRDNNTPYIKKVRVVTTLDYYLED